MSEVRTYLHAAFHSCALHTSKNSESLRTVLAAAPLASLMFALNHCYLASNHH